MESLLFLQMAISVKIDIYALFGRGAVKVVMAACMIFCLIGCQGSPSLTEIARRNADPVAVDFLLNAQTAFEGGYYTSALMLADSAAAHAPELADIPFLRGRVLTALRRPDDAFAAYEEALRLDPEYPGVYLNLGNSAYMLGQPRDALGFYRKEKGVADTAPYLIQLGRAYADIGESDSARIAFEKAIAVDGTNPTGYMWLGQLMEDAGSFEEALSYSEKGLSLSPDNLNYAYVVGVQHLRNGDMQEAADVLERVTTAMPTHYAAHYNLGQAMMALGREEQATYYLSRADTLLEHQKAIDKWEGLVNANSHEPMLWVNLGTALRNAGRIDDAIEALKVAYSLEPQWLELQNNIANLFLMKGDTGEAVQRYMGILEIDSTQADVWLNLGTIQAMVGNYDKARMAWETALRLDPDHPEAGQYLNQLPE